MSFHQTLDRTPTSLILLYDCVFVFRSRCCQTSFRYHVGFCPSFVQGIYKISDFWTKKRPCTFVLGIALLVQFLPPVSQWRCSDPEHFTLLISVKFLSHLLRFHMDDNIHVLNLPFHSNRPFPSNKQCPFVGGQKLSPSPYSSLDPYALPPSSSLAFHSFVLPKTLSSPHFAGSPFGNTCWIHWLRHLLGEF